MSSERDDTRDQMTAVLHGLTCVQRLLETVNFYTPGQKFALDKMTESLAQARHHGLSFIWQRDAMRMGN